MLSGTKLTWQLSTCCSFFLKHAIFLFLRGSKQLWQKLWCHHLTWRSNVIPYSCSLLTNDNLMPLLAVEMDWLISYDCINKLDEHPWRCWNNHSVILKYELIPAFNPTSSYSFTQDPTHTILRFYADLGYLRRTHVLLN